METQKPMLLCNMQVVRPKASSQQLETSPLLSEDIGNNKLCASVECGVDSLTIHPIDLGFQDYLRVIMIITLS